MATVLAVDWDQHEARYVLAAIHGRAVKVRVADSVPLVDVAEGGGEPQPDLGASLAAAMARHKVGRVKALVGVERSSIELLHFTLPPAKDDELPELVANQAMRESSVISEQWVLDFVPMDNDPSVPRQVTVAAIPPDAMERIRQQCSAAAVTPARMLLRPFASASLFLRKGAAREEASLLVNRVGSEADLSVIADGALVFSRTVRLPEDATEAESNDRLVMEIQRTLAVAPPSRLSDEGLTSVYLFGAPDDQQELIDQISERLSLSAKTFDPFVALGVPEQLIPPNCGRFGSLLGMLVDEAAGKHAIDFLHPRRASGPVSRWRIAAIAGGVAAAVVIAVAFYLGTTLAAINRDNRELASRVKDLNETMRKAVEQKKRIEAIAEWKGGEIIWLDELRDLSIRFPSARDAVVLRMSMRPSQSAGGTIDLQGLVRDPKVVVNMESQVRDEYRRVRSRRIQERTLEKDYTWIFESSMSVARRTKDHYVSHLPPEERPVEEPGALAAADNSGDAE